MRNFLRFQSRAHSLGIVAAAILLQASCTSRTHSNAADNNDPKNAAPAPVPAPAPGPGLNPATQYNPKNMTGQELWEVTQANIFGPKVQEIEIRMNEASYGALYQDERDRGCSSNFDGKWAHIRSLRFNEVRFNNVAMRVRGNTSVCIPRLQFTLSFDRTKDVFKKNSASGSWEELKYDDSVKSSIESQTLFGLDQISLRRSQNDTSASGDYQTGALTREFVSSWTASQAERVNASAARGAGVYRVGYAKVIWRLCKGDGDKDCSNTLVQAYKIAENIDKSFFKMRWDDNKPTVFQHNQACGFKSPAKFSVRCYEPKYLDGKKFEEEDSAQVTKATELITGPQGLMTKLENVKTAQDYTDLVDVSSAINLVMSSSMVGHWDSAIGNFNNDFVYYNSIEKKWKFSIWDLDNSFGPHASADLTLKNVAKQPRPLFDPLINIPELADRFKKDFKSYLNLLHTDRNGGPMNDKIIEARDCYVGELNNDRPGQGSTNRSPEQEFLDKLCAQSGIWSTSEERKKDFFFLNDAEKMDKAKTDVLFDFKKNRYVELKSQLD